LRWLLLLPAVLAVVGAGFAIRWYVGNIVTEYTSTADADGIEMARLGARWAPDNALAHWRLGSLQEANFSAANLAAAVSEYRIAVAVEPNDFRYWMELGRAFNATGDDQNAEKALRRAVELAPSYSHPRWQYGNLLLRQGRVDEAFAELARAAAADDAMQAPVFGLASQVFSDDPVRIAKALSSPALRLQFALNLINADKPAEAINVIHTVAAADRKSGNAIIDEIVKAFIAKNYYHAAVLLMRESPADATELPAPEQIFNGGFEASLMPSDDRPFHWSMGAGSPVQINIDNARPHSGQGSLRMTFKSSNKLDSIPMFQKVIVEPDTQYRLQFYTRTEGLVSASGPRVVIKDLMGKAIAASAPSPSGTNDWRVVAVDFKTRPKDEGIVIAFARDSCENNDPICPIFGSTWYDDFSLQRIGGSSPAARAVNR
jgi:thioredoxin-like negative regulator of GroEL